MRGPLGIQQANIVSDLLSDLKQHSLSDRELVLRLPEALEAVKVLAAAKVPVLGWEGWIRHPDGTVGHSREHQGTVSVEQEAGEAFTDYVDRSLSSAQKSMIAAQEEWDRRAEVPGGQLYFCITPG
jgi:hypothetical protein